MKKIYFAIAACAMFAFAACSGNSTGTDEKDTTDTTGKKEEVKADKVDTIRTASGKDSLYITTKADGSTDTAKAQ